MRANQLWKYFSKATYRHSRFTASPASFVILCTMHSQGHNSHNCFKASVMWGQVFMFCVRFRQSCWVKVHSSWPTKSRQPQMQMDVKCQEILKHINAARRSTFNCATVEVASFNFALLMLKFIPFSFSSHSWNWIDSSLLTTLIDLVVVALGSINTSQTIPSDLLCRFTSCIQLNHFT